MSAKKRKVKKGKKIKHKPKKKDVDVLVRTFLRAHELFNYQSGDPKTVLEKGGLEYSCYCYLRDRSKNEVKALANIASDIAGKHFFTEGNKRTAYFALCSLLDVALEMKLDIDYKEASKFMVRLADEEIDVPVREVVEWIEKHAVSQKEEDDKISQAINFLFNNPQTKEKKDKDK